MLFQDRALIDGPARITREGHLVASARVAKANNIQDYMPSEIDMPPKADGSPYRIFRPESAVFAKDALASAAHRPITIDHPKEDVTAKNWKRLAVGDTGGEILRDGDFVRIPVMIMDERGVTAASSTHQEFSLGYDAQLDMTPGKFGDAEYDGSISDLRYNHLALVPSARGGQSLRIVDERPAPLRDSQEPAMKIKIGDAEVDATNAEAVRVAVDVLNGKMADAATRATTAEAKVAEHAASIVAKDAEIVTLKQQVADSAITPDRLRDAAKSFAQVTGKAKALGVTITDAMDEASIKKAVVTAKMGDAAAKYTAEQVDIAFAVLTKDAKVADADPLRDAISGEPINVGDAATLAGKAWEKSNQDLNAWRAA